MTASNTLTFDQATPHRADTSELGGGAKEDNATYPPDPVKHPCAAEYNQFTAQHAAANRVLPLARLFVSNPSGTPTVSMVQALGSTLVPGDFTVVDNGVGDVTIWWTTGTGGKLPAAVGVGGLTITNDVAVAEQRALLTSVSGNPAVRVKTKTYLSAGIDASFTVEIY